MNPDQYCNFNCRYCEVQRVVKNRRKKLNVKVMARELEELLTLERLGKLREIPDFKGIPEDLLLLKCIHLSGDGEPTFSPYFSDVVQGVIHLRQAHKREFCKMVLFTNGTGLNREDVKRGIEFMDPRDEIWVKLDAGTQDYFSQMDHTNVSMQSVLDNIVELGKKRVVTIQSLFCSLDQKDPPPEELNAYIKCLKQLKARGAKIAMVQVYSMARQPAAPGCRHLPLQKLSQIARRVRTESGLAAEVF